MRNNRRVASAAGLVALMLGVGACGSSSTPSATSTSTGASAGTKAASNVELTLYNAQHEDLMKLMTEEFTKATGIKVRLHNGEDPDVANQIVQEGAKSPADVFVTENSPAMVNVASKGLFAKVDDATLAQVPAQFAAADKDWVGFAGRSTVFVYNPAGLKAADLPASLMDLSQPKWKDKVGISPGGADFQAIVGAVLALKGEAATKDWLKGLKENAKAYDSNSKVLKAVNDGGIASGVIYHYYWFKDQEESGANSKNVTQMYFGKQDPGAFLSISGAGVLKSSKHPAEAQQFVKWLNSPAGQKVLGDSKAMEYPIGNGAVANKALKPLSELQPPTVAVASLNSQKVRDMMTEAGFL
jgi:iron(III) transport system substrate-binding protein